MEAQATKIRGENSKSVPRDLLIRQISELTKNLQIKLANGCTNSAPFVVREYSPI